VAATQIGIALGTVTPATAAAFVAAGLLSALLFPATALGLLRRCEVTEPTLASPVAPEATTPE
jgi:hypothetical protein